MYWVYALYSRKLDRLYVGQTQNLEKRLAEHQQGDSFYTRRGDDWEVIYQEEYATRGEAMIRERELKSNRGRRFLRDRMRGGG